MNMSYRIRMNRAKKSAAALGLAASIAGYGSFSVASAAAAGAGVSKADVSYAKATLAAALKLPGWSAPGPAVRSAGVKGKSVLLIPLTTAVSFCNSLDTSTEAVGKKLGMHVSVYPTTGSTTQWAAGIEQGISEHVNAIILECAIDASVLTPQLEKAKAAGIPVFDTVLTDPSQPVPSLLAGVTSDDYDTGMRDEALSAVANENGSPVHALLLTTYDIPTGRGMATAYTDEIRQRCGSACTVDSVNIPLAQWAQQVQSTVSSALTAHPDINTVAIEYDGMVPLALPSIAKYPKVGMYAYGGGDAVVKLMSSTPQLKMDVGEGASRIGYTVMDEVIRSLTKQKAIADETVPIRVFTAANAAQEADATNGYGQSFVSGFEKLWGLGS
jgi:ribose transport system substrate-binding protein